MNVVGMRLRRVVDKHSAHVDNVVSSFEQDCVHNLCNSPFVVIGAGSKIGHFINIVRE
jgi:hypothetical protein